MSRVGFGRNDPCFCGSGKKYKKCCYPRTLPDFSKPNAGIPTPFEEREAFYRALSRLKGLPPPDGDMAIDQVDVGRTRLMCAPLPPYGDGVAVDGTLAPPTPSQIEAKYEAIKRSNPEGATEVVVTYTCPEMFGIAEARVVFDADEDFHLVSGDVVTALDLFRGMQVVMSNGTIGSIVGNPERRYEIPVPPLPYENGLWTSRVMGRWKHTAYELVEFRWGGQIIRVTPGHLVWSADRRGWVGADELLPGELIRVMGNQIAPVEGQRQKPGLIEVFGIEVEYFHNYFVGGGPNAMLVHNGPPTCLIKPAAEQGLAKAIEHRAVAPNFNEARRMARGLSGVGESDTVPFVSELGPHKGRTVGRMTPDGKKGWRIDFDPNDPQKGFHINWWDRTGGAKRKDWLYGYVYVEGGTEAQLLDLLLHAFGNVHGI